ncbi:hypothetical protein BJ165DRAFT_1001331 [Panaeolus papilionaceus]|nr:hypothetical protein BJ165DRAFT_1001331 [Panaeolus papilionaceus]
MRLRSTNPFLPLELERAIFEMAFNPDNLASNVNMTLVASRVREWIRPLIFRIFNQDTTKFYSDYLFPDFERHPSCKLEEVGVFAKHLFVGGLPSQPDTDSSNATVLRLLQHCPNLENFACWAELSFPEQTLRPILERPSRLRRFTLSLPSPSHHSSQNRCFPPKFWRSPAFQWLTHLDLTYCPDDWPFEELHGHPSLTHLNLYSPLGEWPSSAIQRILAISSLRVLVVSVRENTFSTPAVVNTIHNAESWQHKVKAVRDLRIVLMHDGMSNHDDWMRGAKGLFDIWSLSECIITARERRYFKSSVDSLDFIYSGFDLESLLTPVGNMWYTTQRR